ncbi:MAG: hypothetical protein VB055_06975 [Oscillospiraceae bacterium]|nr:hypothetical protein [Oscillospiraceae bacterium]
MADKFNPSDPFGSADTSVQHPPFPPCPPGPRGPAGPPGQQGLRGPAGSLNYTAQNFVYAQLAHLLEQIIDLYPGVPLYVFLPGISPWWISGIPTQVYKSAEGTYGGLLLLESGEVAFPLSAIAALQFAEDGVVYNPAITYLSKPDFPPGYDTNIITAIHDFVATIPGDIDVLFNLGSNIRSTGPIYLNKYGLIVQADALGNDPAFLPPTFITGIAPQYTAGDGAKKAAGSAEAKRAPTTRIQATEAQP